MEFHVSRQARDHYQFDEALYSLSGNVLFANFAGARAFAQKMNQKRNLVASAQQAVRAGEINAMGLIDEILHHVLHMYREQANPKAMEEALVWLKQRIGRKEVERTLVLFATDFPPLAVYRGEQSLAEYYMGSTDGIPNEQVLLEEMLMLWLENKNPAFGAFQELFDDKNLSLETAYLPVMGELHRFFDTQPPFGPENQNLIDMLRAPALAFPNSLFGQLGFIRDRWTEVLGRYMSLLLRRLLTSIDLMREEEQHRGFGGGPGPIEVPVYDAALREVEVENFSPDRDWMPRLVLIAKNTYVWMDQLSREYQREITRLDQIPDEELEKMARWGFTGLWLIGLWERSRASARIKQMMGNPEALASAYSLYDYRIADDLGGEEAFRGLRDKAWRYGIRLASDMVPNHMGIDSPWVVEHPDWFLSLDYSPFPAYTFSGPDLSDDGRATINLEDHYYTRSDAAVVFQDIDHRDGHVRYIYHGNDGTTMPWNDTAQLNYLKAEVREGVIQTILAVARRFPIIRFDAAMTLAKLHYQRLWFPTPGTGGAIPSRAEFGLTKEQFDQLMPVEFWREVVDRVAQEAPDTLLLAEAFWLMESYFVRTLGMHRVYNSAFMNLLRNEENAKYRLIIKNTLEFDPEILKRYVNFLNNPDERTAVDQFGKGDKYFGICLVMATMPGLPMFGHGQVEGYSEKYGMEFKRAYWDEKPDPYLVERHKREIFPLLHRRALFGGVDNFLMYDFFTASGSVYEDVYAYSNGLGRDRALVVFHNKFGDMQGWIRVSAGFSVKGADGERSIIQRTLGEGLGLRAEPNTFCIFRDVTSGLEYIRPSLDLAQNGLFLDLHAYQYHAFIDFHEVVDDEWGSYRRISEFLGGRGVPNVMGALQELLLQPVLRPFGEIVNAGYFQYLLGARLDEPGQMLPAQLLDEARDKLASLMEGINQFSGRAQGRDMLQRDLRTGLRLALSIPTLEERYPLPGSKKYEQVIAFLKEGPGVRDDRSSALLFAWLFLHNLGKLSGEADSITVTLHWINEWQLGRAFSNALRDMGADDACVRELSALLKVLVTQQNWFTAAEKHIIGRPASTPAAVSGTTPSVQKAAQAEAPVTQASTRTVPEAPVPAEPPAVPKPMPRRSLANQPLNRVVELWLADADVQHYLGVHSFEGVLWFRQERFEALVWWMAALAVFEAAWSPKASASLLIERLMAVYEMAQKMLQAEEQSEFQIAKLMEALR